MSKNEGDEINGLIIKSDNEKKNDDYEMITYINHRTPCMKSFNEL